MVQALMRAGRTVVMFLMRCSARTVRREWCMRRTGALCHRMIKMGEHAEEERKDSCEHTCPARPGRVRLEERLVPPFAHRQLL